MFSFARKNQKFSGAFLLALFFVVFFGGVLAPVFQPAFGAEESEASKISTGADLAFGTVLSPITITLYAVQYLLGYVIKFELQILTWVMSVFDWNNTTIVSGWTIVRDVANLFFILVIIIIAFATVLQIESYGMKQLLPKLIFIALLLNFSLVICGFLINFSDAFGNKFKDAFNGGGGISASIGTVLQVEKPTSPPSSSWWEKIKNKVSEVVNTFKLTTLLTTALNVFAQLIMIFTIAAGIFFMTVRQVSLMMLVILSPMALVCLLIPFLNSYWDQWKKAFIKWIIFYPIYMFFLYVAVSILISGAAITAGTGLSETTEGASGMTSVKALWQTLIASMFLIGAIMVAQQMSVAGAGAIGSFGKGALKTMTGVGLAKKAYGAVKERAKEEKELRGAQLRARFIPAALAPVAKRKAELKAAGIEKKRAQEFEKTIGLKRDEKGNVVYGIEGVERATKRFANNPTSRFHKIANQYLEKEIPQRKKTPLTKEDIEKLEESISKK